MIKTANNEVIGDPIHVGTQPTRVAFSPDGKRAYVTNEGSNTVSVIDTYPDSPNYNKVIGDPIQVGTGPIALAVSDDGTRLYVVNIGSNDGSINQPGTVSVISTDTVNDVYTVIDTDPDTEGTQAITVGNGSQGLAVSPDGTHVYVGGLGPVSVIDTTTYKVTHITVGAGSFGLAVSPKTNRVYVTSATNADYTGTIVAAIDTDPASPTYNMVIDIDPNTPGTQSIPVGPFPMGLAVSPDGSLVYVTHYFDHTMSVIDTHANTVIDTIDVGDFPLVVAVTPDDGNIYVTNDNYGSDAVNTVTVISFVPSPTTP